MIHSSIRHIVFDFGGVLLDIDKARCVSRFRELGVDSISHLLGLSVKQQFLQDYELGNITTAQFREQLCSIAGCQLADANIDAAWNSFLLDVPQYKLDMLLQLRKHYNVLLLSNTNELHWQWSLQHVFGKDGHVLSDYFDQVYLSFEQHMAKPDEAFFRYLLQHSGIDASAALFIDDLQDNVDVAAALGFQTYCAKQHEDWRHLFQ